MFHRKRYMYIYGKIVWYKFFDVAPQDYRLLQTHLTQFAAERIHNILFGRQRMIRRWKWRRQRYAYNFFRMNLEYDHLCVCREVQEPTKVFRTQWKKWFKVVLVRKAALNKQAICVFIECKTVSTVAVMRLICNIHSIVMPSSDVHAKVLSDIKVILRILRCAVSFIFFAFRDPENLRKTHENVKFEIQAIKDVAWGLNWIFGWKTLKILKNWNFTFLLIFFDDLSI